MKRLFPYAALCFALLISAKAAAATSARIFELMPANEFKRILADLNLAGEIDKDGDVTVKLENHTVLVLIGSYQGQVIQFRYSSTAKATPSILATTSNGIACCCISRASSTAKRYVI